jgi:hypothetical protein
MDMGQPNGNTSNKLAGSPGGGNWQNNGVGNSDDAFVEATRKGKYPDDNTGPNRSQGETAGAGSLYGTQLNERPNLSNPRNRGPERAPSRMGATPLPVVTANARHTGRVGG